jgi:aminoglycoside phosphotransferase (APT) family kinase protein
MPLALGRDPALVAAGVREWMASRGPAPDVVSAERPSEGLSSDTIMVTISRDGSEQLTTVVVRLAPQGEGAFPEYDLAVQLAAQRLAAAHGVPVPDPLELVTDRRWLGAPFLVMPAVPGHVPRSVPLADAWVTDASVGDRSRLYEAFIDVLSQIHATPIDRSTGIPSRNLDAELDYWQRYLDWCAEGQRLVPRLWAAFDWCRDNRPGREPDPVLLWGDVRLGNVIFDQHRRVAAVLDWEMASLGPPEHDVAWWRTLEATQDEMLGRRVEGFPDPAESRARYEQALGRPLWDLEWYEVFALVRSTAVMTRIAWLNERAGVRNLFPITDNPLVPLIERRIERLT